MALGCGVCGCVHVRANVIGLSSGVCVCVCARACGCLSGLLKGVG